MVRRACDDSAYEDEKAELAVVIGCLRGEQRSVARKGHAMYSVNNFCVTGR